MDYKAVSSAYDGFNRLTTITETKGNDTKVSGYTYNSDDLRIKKSIAVNGGTPVITTYQYDRENVILEMDESSNIKDRYVRGINYIARVDGANNLSNLMYNAHGDVVQTVSETGTVQNSYDYDIWGSPTLEVEQYSCAIRYAGEYLDTEMGMYFLRARFYDPYVGRFVSEDTYLGDDKEPLSLNLYTYCKNNPVIFIDPCGHFSLYYYDSRAMGYRRTDDSSGRMWDRVRVYDPLDISFASLDLFAHYFYNYVDVNITKYNRFWIFNNSNTSEYMADRSTYHLYSFAEFSKDSNGQISYRDNGYSFVDFYQSDMTCSVLDSRIESGSGIGFAYGQRGTRWTYSMVAYRTTDENCAWTTAYYAVPMVCVRDFCQKAGIPLKYDASTNSAYVGDDQYKNFEVGTQVTPINIRAQQEMQESINDYASRGIPYYVAMELCKPTIDAAWADVFAGPAKGFNQASENLAHFLSNTGSKETIDFSKMINEAPLAHDAMVLDINAAMEAAEMLVVSGKTTNIVTINEVDRSVSPEYNYTPPEKINYDWWYSIGLYRTWTSAIVTNNNGVFTMTMEYNMRDFYNWEDNSTKRGGTVTDGQMAYLHDNGVAKEYEIEGNRTITITWFRGQRY